MNDTIPPLLPGMDLDGLIGAGGTLLPEDIAKYVRNDHGLHPDQRFQVLQMLNTPDVASHLLVGATGAALALAVARYRKMSGTSQVLMSLAGFGLGNIILNKLTPPPKYTQWDQDTGTMKIL